MNKRIICLLLCLSLVASFPLAALAKENRQELHIRSLEEFLTFSKNCILDSYSRDLTVYLDCDLDLSGRSQIRRTLSQRFRSGKNSR